MLVTLTGALLNVGDHLIGARARALLAKHTDSDIINVDRFAISEEHYPLFDKARAVLLCGGPAYQRDIYPRIYPLDYERIDRPIVPIGLGRKTSLLGAYSEPAFTPDAEAFVRRIHENIEYSSCRDNETQSCLNDLGIDNVIMTGCPAWYDLEYLNRDFQFSGTVKQVVFSAPAKFDPNLPRVLDLISGSFPGAEKLCALHHGMGFEWNSAGLRKTAENLRISAQAARKGFRLVDLSEKIGRLKIYDQPDSLHIGYRVHAHIYCMSHRQPTILVSEDGRGVGQSETMEQVILSANDPEIVSKLGEVIDAFLESRGEHMERSVALMRDRYEDMTRFLRSL